MTKILMYSTRCCPFCMMARRLLDAKGVCYEEISVESDMDQRREMQRISGRHTVPQVFIGKRHVGGYEDLAAAEQAGQLDVWLKE
jgi:glutaredoxin 3